MMDAAVYDRRSEYGQGGSAVLVNINPFTPHSKNHPSNYQLRKYRRKKEKISEGSLKPSSLFFVGAHEGPKIGGLGVKGLKQNKTLS